MRFVIKVLVVLALLVVAGLAGVAYLVPTELVRDQVIALVQRQTGREVSVRGETSFSFYPNIGVNLGGVTVSSPPEMGGAPMLRMAALNVDLKLLPLFGRQVEVERFILIRPVFDLRIDGNGRANWRFDKVARLLGQPPRSAAATARPPVAALVKAGLGVTPAHAQSMLQDLRLGVVRIEDGTILLSDERSGLQQRFDTVNMALALPRLSEPLDAKGGFVWRGEQVAVNGRLASIPALLRDEPSPLSITVDSRPLTAAFDGRVAASKDFVLAGNLTGQAPSARNLMHWIGAAVPLGKGLGTAALAGRVEARSNGFSVAKARMSLDGMTGQGDVALRLDGARPHIRANLTIDTLNVNAYLTGPDAPPSPYPPRRQSAPPAPAAPPGQVQTPSAPAREAPAAPQPQQSLTDFIEQLNRAEKGDKLRPAAPQVRGWSDHVIDVAGLRAVDADLKIATGQILYGNIKTGRSAVAASLKDGVLTADLNDLSLYGGLGSGRLTFNGARALPALAMRIELDGVSALPLLKDAMAFDWIAGRTRVALNLSGAGQSQSEIVRSMQGNGSVVFSDGALVGINVPEMVRGLKSGRFDGWRREDRQKTDFSRLSGTFTVQNGVASNKDLEMIGPLMRLTGSGRVDLPREWIDFDLLPRLVGSLEGQGGGQELAGLVIPVKLEGPLDQPKLAPDLEKLMQNPDLAKDAINQIGKAVRNLKKGDGEQVEQLLQNFLGGGQQAPEGQPGQEQPAQQVKPEDVLKNLFRR